jgi:tryptophan-rich hypothetical protein
MRVQRRFLLGSRWTARIPLPSSEGECHFEVIELRSRAAEVVLRAVLTDARYVLSARALADDANWLPGWQSLPPGEARDSAVTGAATPGTSNEAAGPAAVASRSGR